MAALWLGAGIMSWLMEGVISCGDLLILGAQHSFVSAFAAVAMFSGISALITRSVVKRGVERLQIQRDAMVKPAMVKTLLGPESAGNDGVSKMVATLNSSQGDAVQAAGDSAVPAVGNSVTDTAGNSVQTGGEQALSTVPPAKLARAVTTDGSSTTIRVDNSAAQPAKLERSVTAPLNSDAKSLQNAPMLMPSSLRSRSLGACKEKVTEVDGNKVLSWACSKMQGWRTSMQDASCAMLNLPPPYDKRGVALFGVFDGHGGASAACLVADTFPKIFIHCISKLEAQGQRTEHSDDWSIYLQALENAFPLMDEHMRKYGMEFPGRLGQNGFHCVGTTAVVALIECDIKTTNSSRRAVVANCGDSQAILCHKGQGCLISKDHKPEIPEERTRVESAGGCVEKIGPCWRIKHNRGGLNLSRAFGDYCYKDRTDLPPKSQQVTCVPDIYSFEFNHPDDFLLLTCDGVSEVLDCQQAVDIIQKGRNSQNLRTENIVEELVDSCCNVNPMPPWRGCDNITALLVQFAEIQGIDRQGCNET